MLEFQPNHYLQQLQPLRIPAGWTIGWNTFQAIEIPPDGFAGSSLLYLLRHDRRLVIDVEWRPEFDPNGHYHAYVQRNPLPTDESPNDDTLDSSESRSRETIVAWLETWLTRGLSETPPPDTPQPPPDHLHPLRIASGWTLQHNLLTETAPTTAPDFLFRALAEQRRFRLDVLHVPSPHARPTYIIELLYAPWPRTDRGRRRHDLPLKFDWTSLLMHRFVTTNYADLIRHIEAWLWRASSWAVEGH